MLKKSLVPCITFQIGPTLEITTVREDSDLFNLVQPGISTTTFEDQWFTGLKTGFEAQSIDNSLNPKQGFRWSGDADFNIGLENTSAAFSRYTSNLSLYFSPSLSPQFTFAVRFGVHHNEGDFPFYAASTLGGHQNLRGYRSTRFAGRTAFYNNMDMRILLRHFSGYLVRGSIGTILFFDNGRVWTDGEDSISWHQGYGGGIWTNFFDLAIVTASVGFSEDDRLFTLKYGFLF